MLTAGAACVDITPPLGTLIPGLFHERRAEAIHDPLHARSFVVGLGDEAIAVVVCDLIGIKRDQIDRAKAAIEDATGLPPARVLVCCTHTHTGAHTGDDAYTAFVVQRIADAVRLACERREPAEIGWASGHEDRVVFNRRFHMRDGGVRTNPGSGNADVIEAAGPVDPEVGVLCLRRAGGGTVGLLGNYALHYVGGGDHERAVSADYFGWFSQFIQALCGETFVAALANGACGDINNNDVLGTSRPKKTDTSTRSGWRLLWRRPRIGPSARWNSQAMRRSAPPSRKCACNAAPLLRPTPWQQPNTMASRPGPRWDNARPRAAWPARAPTHPRTP